MGKKLEAHQKTPPPAMRTTTLPTTTPIMASVVKAPDADVGWEGGCGGVAGAGGELGSGGALGGAGGAAGNAETRTVGTDCTAIPSAAVAVAAVVPRLVKSTSATPTVVDPCGTVMVAVTITEAALPATSMTTHTASTPAAVATLCCRADVSAYCSTLPLAVTVSVTENSVGVQWSA